MMMTNERLGGGGRTESAYDRRQREYRDSPDRLGRIDSLGYQAVKDRTLRNAAKMVEAVGASPRATVRQGESLEATEMNLASVGQEIMETNLAEKVKELGEKHKFTVELLQPGETYHYDLYSANTFTYAGVSLKPEVLTKWAEEFGHVVPEGMVLVRFSGTGYYNRFRNDYRALREGSQT